ncbi:MAG: site-specific integrase [Bacteroides sp.]
MKSTFSIIFYIKRKVIKLDGSSPIMGRVTVNGTQSQFSCRLYVRSEMWDAKIHQATGQNREARELNKELNNIRSSITKHYKKIFEGMGPLTAERVKNSYLGFDRSSHTLMSVFEKHNEEYALLTKNELRSPSPLSTYKMVYNHLKKFLCKRYKLKDIALEDIQSSFIVDFELFIRKERKCSNNSVLTYLMPLKKMISVAQNNGWLDSNPFYGHRLTYKQKERGYLTTEELTLIMNADLSHCNKNKQKSRDLFIFSCFTGISRIDLHNLTKSNIRTNQDGTTWLSYTRQKTGTNCNLPLLDIPLRIVKKYENSTDKGTLFSMPCFVTCNAHIKYIVKYCGIDKAVTWHLARHTFASEVCLLNGVPIETISRLLGNPPRNYTF